MFRRRTEQVYASLQQVQRRMSQFKTDADGARSRATEAEVEAESPPPAAAAPLATPSAAPRDHSQTLETWDSQARSALLSPPTPPPAPPLTRPPSPTATASHGVPSPGPGGASLHPPAQSSAPAAAFSGYPAATAPSAILPGMAQNPALQSARPSRGPRMIEVPRELLIVLGLVWMVTIFGAWMLGRLTVGTGESTAEGQSQTQRWILVLASEATTARRTELENQARVLNENARKKSELGIPPWFGVRETRNGGLQLVFGVIAPGTYGIDRESEMAQKVRQSARSYELYRDTDFVQLE